MQPFSLATTPIGDFTGATLVPNPETGFLESDPARTPVRNGGFGPLCVFRSAEKIKFIEILKTVWPNISEACRQIGITRETFRNHYAVDTVFAQCIEEIKDSKVDGIETVRFEQAQRPSGALDRMAILNAYRRDIYNPSTKIEIDHKVSVDGRVDRVGNVIDAEIVGTVERLAAAKRKEQRAG